MTVEELRAAYMRYFEARGHRRIPSSSLVPWGDPSLLFTSAGMVQFKPYFLGLERPPASRLTSVQKCFRATDIEAVGDASHLTFFEMLGNFSLGDYFKADAIGWAWEFLTGELGIDPARLWITVYTDDDEAHALWLRRGVPEERILRYSAELGNYWYSGDTGPCGPCSELHYYFGDDPEAEPRLPDGQIDLDAGNFLEIWNLVFMAFDRKADGTMEPLPAQNIDTGAGLERLAWVLQGAASVYDTDQLRGVLAAAEAACGAACDPEGAPAAARACSAMACCRATRGAATCCAACCAAPSTSATRSASAARSSRASPEPRSRLRRRPTPISPRSANSCSASRPRRSNASRARSRAASNCWSGCWSARPQAAACPAPTCSPSTTPTASRPS